MTYININDFPALPGEVDDNPRHQRAIDYAVKYGHVIWMGAGAYPGSVRVGGVPKVYVDRFDRAARFWKGCL